MADLADIEQEAFRVYKKAGGLREPPMDVATIIPDIYSRVHVGPADLGTVQGALVTQRGQTAFYTREKDDFGARNFMLAHLLWHYLRQSKSGQLDLNRTCFLAAHRPRNNPRPGDERDADTFATQLLVPLDLLGASVKFSVNPANDREKQELTVRTQQLAERFAVPQDVMARRLAIFAGRRRPFS